MLLGFLSMSLGHNSSILYSMLSELSDFSPLFPFPIRCLDEVHPWLCVQLSKLKRRMLTEYKLAARTLTKYSGNHGTQGQQMRMKCGFLWQFLFCFSVLNLKDSKGSDTILISLFPMSVRKCVGGRREVWTWVTHGPFVNWLPTTKPVLKSICVIFSSVAFQSFFKASLEKKNGNWIVLC